MGAGPFQALQNPSDFFGGHWAESASLMPELTSMFARQTFLVDQKVFTFTDTSFSILKEDGSAAMQVNGLMISARQHTVLRNISGYAKAVCLRKVLSISPTFFVYSVAPRAWGQHPSDESAFEGQPLYSWAQISTPAFGCTLRPKIEIRMATADNQFEEEPSYIGKPPGSMSPRMEITKGGKGCALIDRSLMQCDFANHYKLEVAAGIDPVLMVSLLIAKDAFQAQAAGN